VRDGWQWPPVGWESGDHRGRIHEATLGQADNSLHVTSWLFNAMTV
jgi:hypothetical protein